MTTPHLRIGIDVGGTFTDFVLLDDAGARTLNGKRLTTPDDPGRAILEGLDRLLHEAGATLADVRQIVHGTTLVTNTVIERKGARIGLVTTRGFRDSLEMGREMRYDLYDLALEKPEPLVPRPRRHVVTERLDASKPSPSVSCTATSTPLTNAARAKSCNRNSPASPSPFPPTWRPRSASTNAPTPPA